MAEKLTDKGLVVGLIPEKKTSPAKAPEKQNEQPAKDTPKTKATK